MGSKTYIDKVDESIADTKTMSTSSLAAQCVSDLLAIVSEICVRLFSKTAAI